MSWFLFWSLVTSGFNGSSPLNKTAKATKRSNRLHEANKPCTLFWVSRSQDHFSFISVSRCSLYIFLSVMDSNTETTDL